MKTQIVYVVVSSDNDLFLEELWASLFSLRIYHPKAIVKVLVDAPTAKRIEDRPVLNDMITEVVKVDVPEHYSPMARSRVIKTSIRNIIEGSFLYVDTDTIICHTLDEIDDLNCDIAAVPDCHLSFANHPFRASAINRVRKIFDEGIEDNEFYFNGGVMYVADNDQTRRFYKQWHENWEKSSLEKKDNADQPALSVTDKKFGYIINCLPDVFNCQLALSLRYLHEAYIVHFFHMDFIKDQSYSPFMGLDIYREIKEAHAITPHAEELIRHCKSSFETTTMAVGKPQINFLFSPTGQAFSLLRQRNKTWKKILDWLAVKIIKYYRGKEKVKEKLKK